jgi:hypothetical protein
VRSCPAASRVAPGGCLAGIGGVWAIVLSFLPVRTRREYPASYRVWLLAKGSRCGAGAGRVITRDEHGGVRAAGPGTRLG